MKFYGYKWEEIMQVRLKIFWHLLGSMYRLQAQENLRWAQVLSLPNMEEDTRKQFIDTQIDRIGVIQVSETRDPEGINTLKKLQ